MNMNAKLKKRLFLFFLILFIFQIFFFSEITKLSYKYPNAIESLNEGKVQNQIILINNTVRNQQRLMLQSIKQSWINYITNEDKKLIEVDDTYGVYPVYKTDDGDKILYDSLSMYKEKTELNYYNIYSKGNDALLLANAKPEWNEDELNKILDLLVAPIKTFGNNGGVIVYDSNSGEIFLDTTPANRLKNGENNIFKDDQSAYCKNKTETLYGIEKCIKIKKDSDSIEDFIYMFNEEHIMGNDSDNFEKYPLGDYNRQFIEKMILPYESFGFDGQPMQLTVLLVSDEQDIYSAYKYNDDNITKSLNITLELNSKTTIILISSIFITMTYLCVIAYLFKYSNNIEKDEVNEQGGKKI